VPKYADGTPIEDFEDVIIKDNGKELKAWDAIARYMQSFTDTDGDGIGNVPDYYNEWHDRKVVDDDTSLGARLKSPNKFTAIIIAAVVVVILIIVLIVFIIVKIVKLIKRRRAEKRNI
jgi:hypothetical protein